MVGGQSAVFEPNDPHLVRIDLKLPRLPEAFVGFKIAQLSDFHYNDLLSPLPMSRATKLVNENSPDLIALTGDFVTDSAFSDYLHDQYEEAESAVPCAARLAEMHSHLGLYAVLGNHDGATNPRTVTAALEGRNIKVLRNTAVPIEKDGARIWLAGLDDMIEGKPDIAACLNNVPSAETVILLAHEPDFADIAARHPVDAQLSGHSHGGQVWLPGIGAPWLPGGARKYPRGLYQVGGLVLYTNFGIGTIRVPVRLNCPPEVTLFTLRRT